MTTIFVGNLSPEVTDSDLRVLFERYGRVHSLRLISRRGQAFVELTPEAADAAVAALHGAQLRGRTLDVVLERSPGGRPTSRSRPSRPRHRR